MLKILLIAGALVALAAPSWGGASIVPAFSKWSSAGMSVDAGKQGTNTMQVIGVTFSKPAGKPTMTISNYPPLIIDATATNRTVDITQYTNITVCKSDATVNTVTIADSAPRAIPLDPLSVQGECATLTLSPGGTWFVK